MEEEEAEKWGKGIKAREIRRKNKNEKEINKKKIF